jgi:hypothetical protein
MNRRRWLLWALVVPIALIASTFVGRLGWGELFLEGRMVIDIHPIVMLAPTMCVALVGMAFSFLGDALRDILDPHTRGIT